jgi:excisionase family DNA binding protein
MNNEHATPAASHEFLISAGLEEFEQEAPVREVSFPPAPALKTAEEAPDGSHFEVHRYHKPHNPAHVDLMKDEYLPDEVARMLGTSLEVIMHAIWRGELKAERKGHHVVCIPRSALLAWYSIRD